MTHRTQGWLIVAMLVCGCRPGVRGPAEAVIEGAYDTETRYTLQSEGTPLTSLASEWLDPVDAIESRVRSQIGDQYGRTLQRGYDELVRATARATLERAVREEAPAWLTDIRPALATVDGQLKRIDVSASLLISQPQAQRWTGRQMWQGISVFRDPDCPTSTSLLCDQFHLSLADWTDAEFPLDVVSAEQSIRVQGDRITLESHTVSLNYGRLGLFLLVDQLLPQDGDEHVGLREVVLAAINCRGLASRLGGSNGAWTLDIGGVEVGISLEDMIGTCEEGVFAEVNRVVDRFSIPMELDMAGTAQLVDTSRDGVIDQITRGNLGGQSELALSSGVTQQAVDGQFIGFRVGDLGDDIEPTQPEGSP